MIKTSSKQRIAQAELYARMDKYSTAELHEANLTAIEMLKDNHKAMLALAHVAASELQRTSF